MTGLGTWGILVAFVLTSSVVAAVLSKLMERSASHLDRVRDGYAEAARALAAWDQYPNRIQRRVDDEPVTRRELSELGSDIVERLAYSSGWVSSENAVMGQFYAAIVGRLWADVRHHARFAWETPPRLTASEMNLRNVQPRSAPDGWVYVQMFSAGFRYRFGWRRYVVPSILLRRQLVRRGLWPAAEPPAGPGAE
jgi:hypothetical protein